MRYENHSEISKMKNTLSNVLSADIQSKLNALRKQAAPDIVETKSLKPSSSQAKSINISNKKHKQADVEKNASSVKSKFNKEELKKYFERINKGQEWLETTWPQLFNRESPKPLKRHIERDILPHVPEELPRLQIREAIYAYVKRRAYLESILNDTSRYDLNGTAVEEISDQQKEFTREILKVKQEKAEERQRRYEARKEYFASKKRAKSAIPEQNSFVPVEDPSLAKSSSFDSTE